MKYFTNPRQIEAQSMEIIEGLAKNLPADPLARAVVKRIIHTTGDPQYAELVLFSGGALEAGQKALRQGANIITDVNLVKTGISARLNTLGGQIFCYLSHPEVVKRAQLTGKTRAMTAMEYAETHLANSIVAIGNAPTALFRLLEILEEKPDLRPALIVGTPVGFVGAAESKELLAKMPYPFITVQGNKGGSMVAASIINALLYSLS
ncbi:MAG: putative precorrin-8x methylmutase cbic/cobh [Peptococcaceae bacterium]|jgi:precorrin-8X/cobalt-precorrin-8 methylmutase|nr:putative precorrin-8x methylmutase cbic/cobh [Peptococcaceae bacterium]